MIKYFTQKLDMLYSSRRALNKESTQKRNGEILVEHPAFAKMLKEKKLIELELSKNTALNLPLQELQSKLDAVSADVKEYVRANNLDLAPRYSCAVCKDSGTVDGAPCKCYLEEYRRILDENKSISAIQKITFDEILDKHPDTPFAKKMNKLRSIIKNQLCNNFDNCKWSNFMISGPTGIGKVGLASATTHALIDNYVSVLHLSSFELINIFLDKHTHKQSNMSRLYDYVLECEMLIINNLGAEPIYKNVTLEYLLSTVEKRLATGKKTMIFTFLDGQSVINRYGEAFLTKFADKRYSLSVMIDPKSLIQ